MSVSSFSAAKYLCKLSGWTLSNLQIQKMLYIAHMAYLGENNAPLINDDSFQAWDYGPVLPKLYRALKPFGREPIPNIFRFVPYPSDKGVRGILEWAYENLRHMRPGRLVSITHREDGAWWRTYNPEIKNRVIKDDEIKREFLQTTKSTAAEAT